MSPDEEFVDRLARDIVDATYVVMLSQQTDLTEEEAREKVDGWR